MASMDCIPALKTPFGAAQAEYTVEVDRVCEAEWSTLLDEFDDANIYQTWAYGAVRWQARNLSHFVLKRGDQVVAMAQLRIVRPGRLPLGIAYLRWGPLCQRRGTQLDPEVVSALASALREEYVVRRGLHLEILPNAFSGWTRAEVFQTAFSGFNRARGISNEDYGTLVLDIRPPLDELRKNLQKKWRNQLNAAERNGLEIKAGKSPELYREFCALYEQMWQRKKFATSVNVQEFLRIQERLPETGRMHTLICCQSGRAIAGLVYSAMGNSAIYLLGATNEDGMKAKGAYLLQWATIQHLKEKGICYYDLGGIDPQANPGVYHFKCGLSGIEASHIPAFVACDSSLSSALVSVSRALRQRQQRRPMHAKPEQAAS